MYFRYIWIGGGEFSDVTHVWIMNMMPVIIDVVLTTVVNDLSSSEFGAWVLVKINDKHIKINGKDVKINCQNLHTN